MYGSFAPNVRGSAVSLMGGCDVAIVGMLAVSSFSLALTIDIGCSDNHKVGWSLPKQRSARYH